MFDDIPPLVFIILAKSHSRITSLSVSQCVFPHKSLVFPLDLNQALDANCWHKAPLCLCSSLRELAVPCGHLQALAADKPSLGFWQEHKKNEPRIESHKQQKVMKRKIILVMQIYIERQ
jgi:hypothetical protein